MNCGAACLRAQLDGSIPEELGFLADLKELSIDHNLLSGTVPASFGQLGAAEQIYIDNNFLVGRLPDSMSRLSRLRSLYVEQNRLTGQLPSSYSSLRSLHELYAYNNSFSGPFPTSWCTMDQLAELILDHNQLTSTLPSNVGALSSVQTLSVAWNKLRGTLPPSLGEMHKLEHLRFDHNDLSGDAPAGPLSRFSSVVRSTSSSARAHIKATESPNLRWIDGCSLCRHTSGIVQRPRAPAHLTSGDPTGRPRSAATRCCAARAERIPPTATSRKECRSEWATNALCRIAFRWHRRIHAGSQPFGWRRKFARRPEPS